MQCLGTLSSLGETRQIARGFELVFVFLKELHPFYEELLQRSLPSKMLDCAKVD